MNFLTMPRGADSSPQKLLVPTLACEVAALDEANEVWGFNCGPAALCTMLYLPPEGVRRHIPSFEKKHYTSPTMMKVALASLGVNFRAVPDAESWLVTDSNRQHRFPTYGLARIQFEGPWLNPGVPPAVAYKYTHWVGVMVRDSVLCVFDVNFLWQSFRDWADFLPELTKQYKRSTGGWHVTHRWQLLFP